MKFLFAIIIIFLPVNLRGQFSEEPYIQFEKESFLNSRSLRKINYPGDQSFDVQYYRLNLSLSYEPEYLTGEVTVSAESKISNLDSIFLDLSDILTVDSVTSGTEKLSFTHSGSKIFINFNKTYNRREIFQATVYYQGVPQTSGLGSFAFDSHNGEPSIWTLSEPYGASDWWPCKDTPGDKADSSDVIITCPTNLTAVSNGIQESIIENSDGTHTFFWKNRYPISHYLISIAVSNYTVYEDYFHYEDDSMLVVHYIYPEVFDSIRPQLDKTIKMLEIFSEKFGEYPFIKEKYGHAHFGRGGMEHQTISSMGIFTDQVIAHELAHQWFGDKVTCADWHHIWLNEGFATFSEGIYLEAVSGKEAYNTFISSIMNRSKGAKSSIYVQNIDIISEIFNGARSYAKGGVVLHMLKSITGDSIFYKILQEYLNDPSLAYGTAVTEDFQRAAEKIYGSSLEYFFSEWIYGENYPRYIVDWSFTQLDFFNYKINVSINQRINSSPVFFTMPVELKFSTTEMDTSFVVFNDKQQQSFEFILKGKPINFLFDPNNYILKDVVIKDPVELLNPGAFELYQNFPNPFNSGTTIAYNIPKRSRVKIFLYDLPGNKVAKLLDEEMDAGLHRFNFKPDIIGLASGVYFYRLETDEFIDTRKLIFLK